MKILKQVSASTKLFQGGLGLDQVLQERHGSDFSYSRCCGALLCVVLLPVVCCGPLLGMAVRSRLLVAYFGVGVSVWSRNSLLLVWFAAVPCFPVLSSFVLCCRVVLCCRALLLLTALIIHLFKIERILVAFLRVPQRAFWPKPVLWTGWLPTVVPSQFWARWVQLVCGPSQGAFLLTTNLC